MATSKNTTGLDILIQNINEKMCCVFEILEMLNFANFVVDNKFSINIQYMR